MKKLVLIDGNALLHRAYHATPLFTTSKGELVNAAFGFSSMLLKVLEDLLPDYIAVAWDLRAPTFRHSQFASYKAHRAPMADGLASQYERVHQIVKSFNIPEFKLPGFEADDLVGTLAKLAIKEERSLEVIIVTGDRDIMQLIEDRIKVLMPKKTIQDVGLYGIEEFVAKYGFSPANMVDYKGLAGDQSDNIPGVKGIGDVTATKLIQKYATVESVYEHLDELPDRTKTLLESDSENALMSKKLATIETQIPIKLDLGKCVVQDFEKEEVVKLFTELEFKSLIQRIPGVKTLESRPKVSNPKPSGITSNLDLEVEPILKKMSATGIYLDCQFLEQFGSGLKGRLVKLEDQIYSTVGHEFNINSPKQLQDILFDELGLPVVKKTKTGRSTDEETLQQLRDAHPVIPLLLEYRQLFKIVSTYIDALPKSVGKDGRIHSTFNVEGAATGRLSSTNPNLQNIPIKGDLGSEMRKAFVAPQGKILLGADYSQIELRILAHLADDPNLYKAFQEGMDIHALTASKIFKVPVNEVSKSQRTVGKTMNFATLYGQGPHALSRQLGVDYKTAQGYIAEYFEQFPKVKNWMSKIVEESRKNGYSETIWGRRRYLPELNAPNKMLQAFGERAAVNHPIQGCLPWETRILTNWGYIPIGELYKSKQKPNLVWDGTSWKEYEVLDRGEAQLAQITFSNGQVLKCDTRHQVLTVDNYGYKWLEFNKLKPGIKVCFSMPTIHEFESKPFFYSYKSKAHNGFPLVMTADEDLWYWLGYYIGDGYFNKTWNRAWVYKLEYYFGEHQLEKVNQCVEYFTSLGLNPKSKLTHHKPREKLSARYVVTIFSQGLGKMLESLGLKSGKTAHTKKLPSRIFRESLKNRAAFIGGIMDSDGHSGSKLSGDPSIHICQRNLLEEIQLLLRTLGVASKIRGPYIYQSFTSYRIDIHRNNLAKVLSKGELSVYQRSLKNLTPQFLIKEAVLLTSSYEKHHFVTRSDAVIHSRWVHGGSSSLLHFNIWMERNGIEIKTPIYSYNEIVEIEKLDKWETTYTLSVPGSHRFDSEGVISKNTSADMIKKAMVEIDKQLTINKLKCQMILQIHDELLFECDPDCVTEAGLMVKKNMEEALKLSVPVLAEVKAGKNWGEMSKL